MGQLTSEKQKELMKGYYTKYYRDVYPKYGKIIDFYIKKFFPQNNKPLKTSSLKSYQTRSKNVNQSMNELAKHSIDFVIKKNLQNVSKKFMSSKSKSKEFVNFLYDFIYRRILIHELRSYIYKHIPTIQDIMKCLKNEDDYKKLKYISSGEYGTVYRLDENRCIKIVDVTQTLTNLKYINFMKEIEISKVAGNIGVGPKIYDAYVCVNDEDSSCYGIIYMEYLHGTTLSKYLDHHSYNKEELKKKLDEKIIQLHSNGILHSDLHSDNVFVILDQNEQFVDIKIIDYGFSQYIKDYIYFRNHYRLNDDLFHFSRHYIYSELSYLIVQKLSL